MTRISYEEGTGTFIGAEGDIVRVALMPEADGGFTTHVESGKFAEGRFLTASEMFSVGQVMQALALYQMQGGGTR